MKRRRMKTTNTVMRWKEEREMLQSGCSSGFFIRTKCHTAAFDAPHAHLRRRGTCHF
jgi:hypothetical protein